MNQQRIGQFLKHLRKDKGLTQEQLAEHFNVSSRTISRWETGNNMPDISILVEIAEFFDVSILEIINGEKDKEKMNEEIKEVAESLSDYANAEKEKMMKDIRNYNVMGTVAIIVYGILRHSGLILQNPFFEKLALFCEIQIVITIIITFAHTIGALSKLQKKNKVAMIQTRLKDFPPIAQIIIAAIVAFVIATLLKLFFSVI
ncbi:MAG: helix-turn-helix domain-containing protein [Lachnoclostridium sp.]|nr:helix-turn-helix domain-containing protein [Lachnoclostridium sp.]